METTPAAKAQLHEWTRAGVAYAAVLFVFAAALLAFALQRAGGPLPQHGWPHALFFLGYGLFTISVGYRAPNRDYYSFDRVAQVASILVLGPVDAAWINGLASLLYPLQRLRLGVPLRQVLCASMNNAGIMTLTVLAAGSLYVAIGGAVPLLSLTGASIVALLVLVLAMQLLNDAAMLGLARLSGRDTRGSFSGFSYAMELGSGAAAVLVALVYNRMELPVLVLLLAVLGAGMLALQQFAVMRTRLEGIVEERTRSLLDKTRELEVQATHDNLTGLFNRRYADQWLTRQLDTDARLSQPLTVALADIDDFKQINDRHSHATGDAVLRRVAAILRERCRQSDMLARYGGEEFLFCFPRTEMREGLALCETLRAAVEDADWSALGLGGSVTLSFGLAARRPESSIDSLLRLADERLYMAKNAGRNQCVA
ncbi:MAG TPA: GGDEF domain-containing protein [Steroidobacteraceae bacterium]|nr:GGDEF domain-containing protein [Steroidobacteraceae bacterium]